MRVPPETVYRLDFKVLVDSRDDLPGRGVGAHAVDLARHIPLLHDGPSGRELDKGAVQVAGSGRLPLRAHAVLEADVELAAKGHDVVRLDKVLGSRGARAARPVAVLKQRAKDDLLNGNRFTRGAGAGAW